MALHSSDLDSTNITCEPNTKPKRARHLRAQNARNYLTPKRNCKRTNWFICPNPRSSFIRARIAIENLVNLLMFNRTCEPFTSANGRSFVKNVVNRFVPKVRWKNIKSRIATNVRTSVLIVQRNLRICLVLRRTKTFIMWRRTCVRIVASSWTQSER